MLAPYGIGIKATSSYIDMDVRAIQLKDFGKNIKINPYVFHSLI